MNPSFVNLRLFGYGILVWLIPFFLAIPLFQLVGTHRIVFKSVMGFLLVLTVVVFWNLYLKKIRTDFFKHSYYASVVWLALSIVPDLFAFLLGFKMDAVTYFTEIAISYLAIPTILIGSAWLLERKLAEK